MYYFHINRSFVTIKLSLAFLWLGTLYDPVKEVIKQLGLVPPDAIPGDVSGHQLQHGYFLQFMK